MVNNAVTHRYSFIHLLFDTLATDILFQTSLLPSGDKFFVCFFIPIDSFMA